MEETRKWQSRGGGLDLSCVNSHAQVPAPSLTHRHVLRDSTFGIINNHYTSNPQLYFSINYQTCLQVILSNNGNSGRIQVQSSIVV